MNSLLIAVFVLLSCHIGHTLDCYSCDYGTCLFPSTISCTGTQVCLTETSSLTDLLKMKKKGCIDLLSCNSDSSVTHLGISVKTRTSCCMTNLCNSAVTPRVSVVTGIAAVVALCFAKLF
ncbi:sperm acrosome membrane-associated protein 4 [Bombina bombina]|uniref:sperm acrosome membrane-associated protein 4 n=1 Tax=Bombina bombina TaxID=8345 RepID=UPI00235A6BD2|nr:sperm acrosome membrane-associated protein 4 [Bombina bombina]